MTEDKKARLFIGARVSMAVVHDLTRAVADMRERAAAAALRARWVAPASYHVTLQFIGWARRSAIEAIRDEVARELAGAGPFEFGVRGVGAFPKPGRARVLWAGIDDPASRLADLAARARRALDRLGYETETRPFHPHVTLARIKEPGDASAVLEPWTEQVFSDTRCEGVVLFESLMKAKGSEYHPVVTWPLEAAAGRPKRQTRRVEPGATEEGAGSFSAGASDHGEPEGADD